MILSFVVPCWNEAEGLEISIAAFRDAGDACVGTGEITGWELVAVDDGSTDATPRILDTAAADSRVRSVTHQQNAGLGAAIRSGLAAAKGDLVLYTDADMPVDLMHDLPRALRLLRLHEADIVSAYRLTRGGEGPRRAVYSAAYNTMVRAAFRLPLRDVNFAFKLMRREVLDGMTLRSDGSFIDAELLASAQARGFRTVQFGVDYFPRTRGVSTLSSPATIAKIVTEMFTVGREVRRAAVPPTTAGGGRLLIVNADDYGLTVGVSEGILRAHRDGIVTSTSVLAVAPGFAPAGAWLRDEERLGVGVHLAAVGEDPPLLSAREIPTLVDRTGRFASSWRTFLPRAVAGKIDPDDLRREFTAQLDAVRALGVRISHVDTHQHLHLWPTVREVVVALAIEAGIGGIRVPRSGTHLKGRAIDTLSDALAKRARAAGLVAPDATAGLDEAGRLHGARLERTITMLASRSGAAEIGCHPGDPRDTERYRWGYDWALELAALTSPRARELVEANGFALGTYHDLARL